MIQFDKAKLSKNEQTGKKGVVIHRLRIVALVTEASAKALGDDVRNTLYKTSGVIRQSFSQMDTTHAFADASFHLSVTGVKGAELRLEGVLAHRFRIAKRGDGEKKPKQLVCAFEVEYVNRSTGASSIELWNFVNSFLNAEGSCRLKYPEQQAMFTEGKREKEPEIVPGVHKYGAGKFTAEIRVVESKGGWTSTRKAMAQDKRLPMKPGVERPSEAEALALAAYDVRQFADKAAAGCRVAALKKQAAELSTWAGSFAGAYAGSKPEAAKTLPITRHTS